MLPGHSGNPGGRPRELTEVVNTLRLEGHELTTKLLALAKGGSVEAIKVALAYAYGSPATVVVIRADREAVAIAAEKEFANEPEILRRLYGAIAGVLLPGPTA